MTNDLYDPATMLEAEALNHRAWCDHNECCLTPAVTPLGAPPIQQRVTTLRQGIGALPFSNNIHELNSVFTCDHERCIKLAIFKHKII